MMLKLRQAPMRAKKVKRSGTENYPQTEKEISTKKQVENPTDFCGYCGQLFFQ